MLVITLAAPAGVAMAQTIPALRDYQWKRRVLVLLAPPAGTADTALHASQQREFAAAADELAARDVAVLDVPASTSDAGSAARQRELRRQLGVVDGTFAVVLVGKDGTVKLRRRRLLSAATVLATIDAMPMGAAEARRRRPGGA